MELVIIIVLSRVMIFYPPPLGDSKGKCPELTPSTFSEYSRQRQSFGALTCTGVLGEAQLLGLLSWGV